MSDYKCSLEEVAKNLQAATIPLEETVKKLQTSSVLGPPQLDSFNKLTIPAMASLENIKNISSSISKAFEAQLASLDKALQFFRSHAVDQLKNAHAISDNIAKSVGQPKGPWSQEHFERLIKKAFEKDPVTAAAPAEPAQEEVVLTAVRMDDWELIGKDVLPSAYEQVGAADEIVFEEYYPVDDLAYFRKKIVYTLRNKATGELKIQEVTS